MTIGEGFDLAKLAGDGRIATGDVQGGAGRQICQGGAGKARRLDGGRAEVRAWPKTCAPRWRWSRAARRRSASSMRPTPRSSRSVKIVGVFPGRLASADHLSGRRDRRDAKPERRAYLDFLRSAGAKAMFEQYGFTLPDQAGVVDGIDTRVRPHPRGMDRGRAVAADRAVATVVALPFGIAIAWLLARKNFWGKGAARRHRASAAGAAAGRHRLSAADQRSGGKAPIGAFLADISASCSRSAGPARRSPAA